jgi:hemerythrin-like domain-containing protein
VEHERILEVAWALSERQRATGVADGPLRDQLAAMLEVHVDAEEAALYPLLVETGDLDSSARDRLEAEHAELHAALREGRFDHRAFYELAAHIEEEELELFPMAMFGFDDDDWAVLASTPRFIDATLAAS